MSQNNRSCSLISISLDGHRSDYVDFFNNLLKSKGINANLIRTPLKVLNIKDPTLFLMVEESFFQYFFISILRSVKGLKSCGLLFRGKEAANAKSLKLLLKKYLLKFLLNFKNISTLSIIPFPIDNRLQEICTDWIFDPQLWDIDVEETKKVKSKLSQETLIAAKGKKIIISLGVQNKDKGFDNFVRLLTDNKQYKDEFLFIAAGKLDKNLEKEADEFTNAGGILINRFIDNDEMMSLYNIADIVYAVYDQKYDQASGILGRAIQLNKPVMIRENSVSNKICQEFGFPHIAVNFDDNTIDKITYDGFQTENGKTYNQSEIKKISLDKINKYLGL